MTSINNPEVTRPDWSRQTRISSVLDFLTRCRLPRTIYIRGMAYLERRDGAKAAAEFQKILDHRGLDGTSALLPLAQLNLARAYALQGDTTKPRTAYQDFLALWKDADLDVPVLKDAKAEYAKLK